PRRRGPLGRMVRRALQLRCPRCGGGGIWRSWFGAKHACPTCGQVLARGESDDYWLGAYALNLVAAELIPLGIGVVVVLATWPTVAWNFVWALTIVLAVVMPFVTFPFMRNLWLAFDLHFRPHEPGDTEHPEGRRQS
ncbi:MAG: DUF983 domain-containing protein, partial [Ktedonobacterales bacterium]